MRQAQLLTIFHFNDVYNVQPFTEEPKAGAAYFNTLLQREKKKYQHPLTLFLGDAFSPSLLSEVFEGQNMVKPLNAFGIDLACYGNHDLDYELEHVKDLVAKTNFPWLLSNIYDKRTKRRLAEGLQFYTFEKNGVKIGLFSLAEKEWIDTLYPYYKEILEYIPFIDFANEMVVRLREKENCELVIALTHMMKYNDIKLAKAVKGIDLILGGHDHLIVHQKVNDSIMVKSGTDFRNFSIIKVHRNEEKDSKTEEKDKPEEKDTTFASNGLWRFEIKLMEVHHERQKIEPDVQLNHYIKEMYKEFKIRQQKIACFTKKPIDLRFKTIRKEQVPFLQFFTSFYRHETGADIGMMNCGGYRMDTYIEPGPITFGVMENMIADTIVVKLTPAKILIEALEICVAMYPNLSGRYSAFSGIGFTWDASKKPGERVLVETIKIQDNPLDMDRIYKIGLHKFMGKGGDGFACFKDCVMEDSDGLQNRQLLNELLHVNHYLLDTYMPLYPGRFKIIEYEGHQVLELDLPEPKNVHMIMSTGHPYESH